MTSFDADIDWGSNKKEIVDGEDNDDNGGELQESDDDDSSLEIDNKEDSHDDDTASNFNHPAQVSLCALLIVNYLNLLISFIGLDCFLGGR